MNFHKLILVTLFVPFIAFASDSKSTQATEKDISADTQKLQVKGVHCASCIQSIKQDLCKSGAFAECKVRMLDRKKELGEITLKPNQGQSIDLDKVKSQVKDLGYEIK